MKIRTIYWTKVIFNKVGFYSSRHVFNMLEKVDDKKFAEYNLICKEEFIKKLNELLVSIENTGDIMKDAREMLAPGSIFENSFPGEYGSLRTSYISDRKKLEKQLMLIKVLFT